MGGGYNKWVSVFSYFVFNPLHMHNHTCAFKASLRTLSVELQGV